MLQPNRVKFRNMHRGRRKGVSVAGSKISFGEFGLKATEFAPDRGRASRDDTLRPSRRQDVDSRLPGQERDGARG